MSKKILTAIVLAAMVVTLLNNNPSKLAAAEILPGIANDGSVYTPPSSGTFSYNNFVPANVGGASYIDPIFGTTIRRLSTDHNSDDSYARNMWWNADGTKYLHRSKNDGQYADYLNIIDATTGVVTHNDITIGDIASDAGFDPIDPNVLYKYVGNTIHKITLGSNGAWSDSVYFTAPSTIKGLGGTLNWLDANGRFMLVRYGNEPSVHVYDRQNLSAGPYANPIDGSTNIDTNGYLGLSPDGKYVVGYSDVGGYNMGEGLSWSIDDINKTVSNVPTKFWSLCGDHGTFISSSDGRNYMVVSNCYDSPDIWRVDITNNAAGPLPVDSQKILPNNKKLLTFPNWNSGVHFSSVAKGAYKDWVFISTEDVGDTFNSTTTNWTAYEQEIIAINVLSGEVRRLAHHRSRSISADYYNTPRLTVSWGGENVAWNSNFNQSGLIDVFVTSFASAIIIATTNPPPPPPVVLPPPPVIQPPLITSDTISPTVRQFDVKINGNNKKLMVSWRVKDLGGSYLRDVSINRADYNSRTCNEYTKWGCSWIRIKTIPAPLLTDSWASVTYDNSAVGTYYYGMTVTDNNDNRSYEPEPLKAIIGM